MKRTILLLFVIICFISLSSADSSDYEIEKVYVNGMNVEDKLVQVESGNSIQIEVFVKGTGSNEDVRVSAWIGGYQYGSIEEVSEIFEVEDDVSYRKILMLDLPEDLDVENNEYTLHIQVYDDVNREEKEYTLFIESEEHKIKVEDVILSSSSIGPGEYLGIKVRLANFGENDEEDIKVIAFISELGISSRVYVDELDSGDQKDAPTIYLNIPSQASGDYSIEIQVDYGNSKSYGYSLINILGEARFDENIFVSVSNINQLVVNEEKTYRVQITNLAEVSKEFSLDVSGIDAEIGNDIIIPPGKTSEIYFVLKPKEEGLNNILVTVSSSDGVYQELYSVNVGTKVGNFALFLSLFMILIIVIGIILFLRKY